MTFFLRRPPSAATEDNPLWLVVLTDTMTVLMLFFLVMYALTQQAPSVREKMVRSFEAKDVVDIHPRPQDEPERSDFLEAQAAAKLKALFADTTVTENMIRVRLLNKVLFASARATLSLEGNAATTKLARVLRDMPNTVVIEGHTDDVPLSKSPYHSNWELSVARSNSVIEQLVREAVPPERLVAAGYGEYRPTAPNVSPAGRARNRRVEILILRDGDLRHE